MMSSDHTGLRPARIATVPALAGDAPADAADDASEAADLSTRQRNQLERRRRVVLAALELADEGGYDAVQMRDVAKKARVALGTIYRYFSSKDEMLVAGLAVWARDIARELSEQPMDGTSAADRLARVLRDASNALDRRPVLMAALVTALASTDPVVDDSRREVDDALDSLVRAAIGDVATIDDKAAVDVDGVRDVISHVWFSVLVRWVGGRGATGTMGDELARTAHLLLDR